MRPLGGFSEHDMLPGQPRQYVSVRATVLTRPTEQCQVVRGGVLWPQVVVGCVLHFPDDSLRYDVRFTHKRTLTDARKLRPGDRILIEQGQFRRRHGRAGKEFRVKRFRMGGTDVDSQSGGWG